MRAKAICSLGLFLALLVPAHAFGQDAIWRSMFTPGGGMIVALCANHDSLVCCYDQWSGFYTCSAREAIWRAVPVTGVENLNGLKTISVSPHGTVFLGVYSSGLYRSTDRGAHWELSQADTFGIPLQPVFGENEDVYTSTNWEILKSTDDGKTWGTSLLKSDPEDIFTKILRGPDNLLYVTTLKRTFCSTNAGQSWEQVGGPVGAMAIAPDNTITIAAPNGFYESRDSCRTCQKVGDMRTPLYGPNLFYASSGALFYWSETDTGLARSETNGRTWSLVSGLPLRGISTITESDSGCLYAGTEYGMFRSIDQGRCWTSMSNGLLPVPITSLSTDERGRVFVGAWGGIYMSADYGESWAMRTNGLDLLYVEVVLASSRCEALFAGDAAGIHRSLNNGSTWQRVSEFTDVRSICETPTGVLFAGGFDSLFQSTDCGNTWSVTSTFRDVWNIFSVFVNKNGDLYLATLAGLLRSQDNGTHWTTCANVTPGTYGVRTLARDSKGTLFVGTDGVFRSADDGTTWQESLTGVQSVSLAVDGNDYVYAGILPEWGGVLGGVRRSTDGGISWAPFNVGLVDSDTARIRAVAYDSVSGHVYAVQNPGGVARTINPAYMERSLGIGMHSELPTRFALEQNYPNPFNPSTTIRYGLPQRSQVTLAVFNMLGQLVTSLVSGEVEAGNHEVQFDASGLASGVYFYRIQAGTFTHTKKLCVIK
jgi:photosystem II stability/assembly factor-like uncharacterized protein